MKTEDQNKYRVPPMCDTAIQKQREAIRSAMDSLDHLIEIIASRVADKVYQRLEEDKKANVEERFLSTDEVKKMFGISSATVSTWIKKGKLNNYGQGGRNRFKYSEVVEGMKVLKKYKNNCQHNFIQEDMVLAKCEKCGKNAKILNGYDPWHF